MAPFSFIRISQYSILIKVGASIALLSALLLMAATDGVGKLQALGKPEEIDKWNLILAECSEKSPAFRSLMGDFTSSQRFETVRLVSKSASVLLVMYQEWNSLTIDLTDISMFPILPGSASEAPRWGTFACQIIAWSLGGILLTIDDAKASELGLVYGNAVRRDFGLSDHTGQFERFHIGSPITFVSQYSEGTERIITSGGQIVEIIYE